ncbi:MAG TPA: DoxX family protein [Terriglobales bacterium]|nr:DoxX family protein [Terriglobales bacterium]
MLIILLVSWLVCRGLGVLGVQTLATWQDSARYALAVMFCFTGTTHFNKMKHDLAKMVPSVFPHALVIIYVTGVLEFLGAAGLLLPRLRALAGIGLIALLIAMFPANVKAAREKLLLRGKPATQLWLRLPMQLVLIGLLWWSSVMR